MMKNSFFKIGQPQTAIQNVLALARTLVQRKLYQKPIEKFSFYQNTLLIGQTNKLDLLIFQLSFQELVGRVSQNLEN